MTNIDLKRQPTIISFFKDLPNICSLAGLLCSVFAIYFTILGNFSAGLIGIIWAVLFDWADGIIARRIDGRTDHQRAFGGQLDSLIDIVSFGVFFPAVFLLSYGKFSPWFVPFAFIIVASSAMRLSYFNLFGLSEDNRYVGLALDNNVIILSAFFLLEPFFPNNYICCHALHYYDRVNSAESIFRENTKAHGQMVLCTDNIHVIHHNNLRT